MANFPISLELQLRGQNRVEKAIKSAEQLEALAKRISQIKLDKPGAGKLGDDIRKAIKPFKDLARESVNTGKVIKSTISNAQAAEAAFKQLAANVDLTSTEFKNFTIAAHNQERQLKQMEIAAENVIRSYKGMQSVEERAAQLERRAINLRVLRQRRDAKLQEAAARERNARAIQREARAQQNKNASDARASKQAASRKFTDIATGVGFPLLFGGGPGATIGGLVGGAFGGFGGSIIASALGQQLDKLVGGLAKFAVALDSATDSLAATTRAIGVTRTPLGRQIGFAERLGIPEAGTAAAQQRLEGLIGKKGVESFQRLGEETVRLANSFEQLKTTLGAGAADILTPFVKAINATLGMPTGSSAEAQARAGKISTLQSTIATLEASGAKSAAISPYKQQLELLQEQQEVFNENRQLQTSIETVTNNIVGLERLKADTVKMELTARRDTLAVQQSSIAVQQIANELAVVQIRLKAGAKGEEKEILELQQKQLQQQQEAAKAAQENARILAERAIRRETDENLVRSLELGKAITNEKLKELTFTEGTVAGATKRLDILAKNLFIDQEIADVRNALRLLGKNEIEVQNTLIQQFGLERTLRERAYSNEQLITRERRAQYQLAVAEAQQQAQRALSQQQGQFGIRISQAGAIPIGPFAGSAQAERIRNMERELEITTRLSEIDDRRANYQQHYLDLSQDQRNAELRKISDLEKGLAVYQENTKVLNDLIAFQDRYRETLALTQPVTDSLFESVMAVAEGTKSARDAFASFLQEVSQMLMNVAKQMIAQYIAIGVARMFAGIPGAGSGAGGDSVSQLNASVSQYQSSGLTLASFGGGRANGGSVTSGKPYLVGERGPELFVPGAQGNIVPNHGMGGSNIVVNVDATGTQVQGDQPNANKLGEALGAAVRAELIRQKRPGGLLA